MSNYKVEQVIDGGGEQGHVKLAKDGQTFRVIISNNPRKVIRTEVRVPGRGGEMDHWRTMEITPRVRTMMAKALREYRGRYPRRDLQIIDKAEDHAVLRIIADDQAWGGFLARELLETNLLGLRYIEHDQGPHVRTLSVHGMSAPTRERVIAKAKRHHFKVAINPDLR